MEKIKGKAGFSNGLIIPKSDKSGGLAILWKKDIKLEIVGYVGNYIDAMVVESQSGFKWRITRFYGHPEMHRRKESWEQLRALHRKSQLPWICFGDFNEISSAREKFGGARRPQKQIDDFVATIDECGFRDLGFLGPDYTWCNMREGDDRTYLRLDRALATIGWIDYFKDARVHHIVDSTSDHCALLISNSFALWPTRKHRFHFKAMWLGEKNAEM
ncbi:uncharacterized protein LOC142625210 [Castanea sativa]|uniref:uncharacterized protein LOC142625210 n=1 Tax=Castanea sativa TaxID=21020 RepID=UPI003F64C9D3